MGEEGLCNVENNTMNEEELKGLEFELD